MAYRQILPTAFAGVTALCVSPLLAQEPQSGSSATLSVSQRIETGDNLTLEVPSPGRTTLSTTSLRFDIGSETRSQKLALSLGGVLRFGSIPDGVDITTGFADPRLSFSYQREASNAAMQVSASFQQSDVSFARDLSEFVDENGIIVLPEDFDEFSDTGKRNAYSLSTALQIGTSAPLGFDFTLGTSGIDYTDGATQTDIRRVQAGIGARLRFSSVTTGRADLNFDRYDNDDGTERETISLTLGLRNELSDGTVLDARVGYTDIENFESGTTETVSGLIGGVGLQRALVNGSVSADLDATRTQDGSRVTLRFGRDMELPQGRLSARIGATSFDGNSPDLVGSVNWQHELPRGALNLRLNRAVSVNSEDEERLTTSAAAALSYDINSLTTLGLSLEYGLSDGTGSSSRTEQTSARISLNRAVTRDWVFSTGISYRNRDEDNIGEASSTAVFVSLNRSFDLLR